MPLAVRYVQPQKVCNVPLVDPASGANSLQALNLQSVSGVIRQLSSLARHAESIMGDIADILASYYVRTVTLEERSKRLMAEILPALDPDREVLEGFEILHPSSQYRSTRRTDQQLLTQQHWPVGLAEQYEGADKTPALHFFTPLREDGKNAMLYFSSPEFFFEHWRVNIKQQMNRRKTTADVLSPTPGDGEKKLNGVIRSQKTRKESKAPSAGLRRSSSLKRSFRKRVNTYHGSNLSLQDTGKRSTLPNMSFRVPTEPPARFRRNLSRSFRYSFRKKSVHVAKLGLLTKATASVFEGQDIPLPMPDLTTEKTEVQLRVPEEKTKSSLVRRSFSFRTIRDRQSRSQSPNPPIPSTSVLNGMQMHTLATAKKKQETSIFSTLSKRHLENLDLGVTDFETCLTLDSSKRNNSTFKVPEIIRSRPVSPFLFGSQQQKSVRREPPSPPKVLPKPVMTWSDKVLPRERGRSATVSGAGGSEMKQVAVRLRKHLSAVMDRPNTPPTVRPTSSQTSLPVFPPSPAFQRSQSPVMLRNSQIDPPALTRVRSGSWNMNGNGNSRGKPRRPAPPRPNRSSLSKPESSSAGTTPSPTPSSSSIPPPPPVRSDSVSSATTKRFSRPALSEISQTETPAATGFEPVNLTASPGRMELDRKENSVPIGSLSEAQSMQPPGDSLVSVPALQTAPYPNPLALSEMPYAHTPPRHSLVSAGVQTTPSLYLSQTQARQSPPRHSLVSAGVQTTASLYLSEMQNTRSPGQSGSLYHSDFWRTQALQTTSPPPASGSQTAHGFSPPATSGSQTAHAFSPPPASGSQTAHAFSPPPTSGSQTAHGFSPPPTSGLQIAHAFSPPLVSGFQVFQTPNHSLTQVQIGIGTGLSDIPSSERSSTFQRNRSVVQSPPTPPTVSITSLSKPMLRNDSLYISPRKQSIIALSIPVNIEESAEEDTNKRSSRILKAGGVGDGDIDITSTRSNFLVAIQKGIQLRKVQRQETEEDKTDPWDVAAILERRVAIMDSDSEEESEEETDDSDWDK